jgi:hypothetical protein
MAAQWGVKSANVRGEASEGSRRLCCGMAGLILAGRATMKHAMVLVAACVLASACGAEAPDNPAAPSARSDEAPGWQGSYQGTVHFTEPKLGDQSVRVNVLEQGNKNLQFTIVVDGKLRFDLYATPDGNRVRAKGKRLDRNVTLDAAGSGDGGGVHKILFKWISGTLGGDVKATFTLTREQNVGGGGVVNG